MQTFLVFLLFPLLWSTVDSRGNDTRLRALWNLNQMAECRLSYTALVYNDYGCWCGVGGAFKPVDGIDECCQHHDKVSANFRICFDDFSATTMPWIRVIVRMFLKSTYVNDYTWSCVKGNAGQRSEPRCEEGQSKCKQYLCWCDKAVVDCWSQYPRPEMKKTCTREPESNVKHFFHKIIDGIVGFFGTVLDGVQSLFRK
ncbi:Phospholipase A2 [Aphelenchoides besseyi]|nr:Phospholipase A2 [Aphelenchoides besseyi]